MGLGWYLKRLRKMPAREYSYRLGQAFKKRVDRYAGGRRNVDLNWVRFPDIPKTDLKCVGELFPGIEGFIRLDAEKTIEHHFSIFGIDREFGDPINWHLDPRTGNTWPLTFWGDIDYRDGQTVGGIKFAWELNRLHHLPRLAIACRFLKEDKFGDEIFHQLASWLSANPYPKGINWISGIELAIRIINLIYTLRYLGTADLSKQQRGVVLPFIFLHATHLYRYPSKYSSAANHAVAEALGLFAAGLCFPELPGADRWRVFGKQVLEQEVVRQIYPDGSSFEHSVSYLQFVLDHFLVFYLLCREYRENLSAHVAERLKAGLDFVAAILDKNGNYPVAGDDDDGFLLRVWFGSHNNFRSLINTGKVLFDQPALPSQKRQLDQKTFFLLGPAVKSKWAAINQQEGRACLQARHFNNAGFAVIRDTRVPEMLFVGNSGPLGLKPLGAHGHADALSFWLSVGGQPVFVDPGTYLYHSGGKWRHYFRSTAAHNTLCIDGRNQATILADFMFEDFYEIVAPELKEFRNAVSWSAGHDGYRRLDDPVFHRRKITYHQEERCLIIEDNLECEGKHCVKCYFHLHPDCQASLTENRFNIEVDGMRLRVQPHERWVDRAIMKGERDPLLGWYSPRFNKCVPAPVLLLGTAIQGSQSFMSKIFIEAL